MQKIIDLPRNEYALAGGRATRIESDWEMLIDEEASRKMSLGGPLLLGVLTLVLGVGGFFLWSANVEIAAASVATGKIVVASSTKTVTLLESARLKELNVAEGDLVQAGTVLATLDATRAQSTLDQLVQTQAALDARLTRLFAERDEDQSVAFGTAETYPGQAVAFETIISTERRLFDERNKLYQTQLAAEQANISQVVSQNVALQARKATVLSQQALLRQELDSTSKLEAQSLATKSTLRQKQIQDLELTEKLTEIDAEMVTNIQKKAQFELAIATIRNQHFREIVEQIQAAQIELNRVRQEIISARDVVTKAVVRAPQTGKVANIRLKTAGSAIIGGQPFMDIVPSNQELIVEGKVRTDDIDTVHVGMDVEVKLRAFGSSEAFPLHGKVTYVAADAIVDERSGDATFLYRAELDPGEVQKQQNLSLYPGMQADVFIVNGQRTALTYLLEPIARSFGRAFREQ